MNRTCIHLILALLFTVTLHAQTPVSGYILSNTTWTQANSPYLVTGNILVNSGVTLTIEPGVVVKFDTTRSLQVDGELIAIGNEQNRIVFTASDPTPVKGSWGRIQFSNTSVDAVFDTAGEYVSGSVLKYCDVSYGGGIAGDVTLYCDTAAPYFSNCRISECLKHAIRFVQAVGWVDSSSIRNCGGSAIEYSNPIPGALIVKNDTIENNAGGIGRVAPGQFTSIMVQNSVFTNTGNAISDLPSSTSVILENNFFTSNNRAVNVTCVTTSSVSNNTFTENWSAMRGNLGANATISGNIFKDNIKSVLGAPNCHGNLWMVNATVSDNYFENNHGAIYIGAGYSVIQNNIFRKNHFFDGYCAAPFGFTDYYYEFITIGGNGLILNNIIDSTISTTNLPLIKLQGRWKIANNTITNNTHAQITCSGETIICNNRLLNNSGSLISSSGSSGGTYIHDNEFRNNAGSGSMIAASSKNLVINNNEFIDNASSGTSAVNSISGDSARVTFNRFTGNSCSGTGAVVSISGGSADFSSNNFTGNSNSGTSGLVSISGTSPKVTNNRFTGNVILGGGTVTSISNTYAHVHNNDFQGNSGLSCLRVNGNVLPLIEQNNFLDPGIQYEVENLIPFGPGANFNLANNYWGTTNTAHIDSVIKDYFDDANLSVVFYLPILTSPAFIDTSSTSPCTSTICSLAVSGTTVNPSCYGSANGSISTTVSNGTSPYTYLWSTGGTTQNPANLTGGTYTVTITDANFCSAAQSFTLTQPAAPLTIASAVVSDANCNLGGVINMAVGGGTSPYTYEWNDGITTEDRNSLATGTYTVTVTDNNGCTASQSFTIGQVYGPVIHGTVINASCFGWCNGAIDLSVAGTAPFTYDWGAGAGSNEDTTGLCPGTYSVTVADSNNCGIAASFTVTEPAELTAATSITGDISCSGYSDGAAVAVASGGTAPYTFLWTDGQTTDTATGLSAGSYPVVVTDALGCTASTYVAIPDGYRVFVGVIVGLSTAVVNQNAAYSVNANPNYTYSWTVTNGILISGQGTNGIEVAWTSAGTGEVQLIAQDQGCADTVTKSIAVTDTTRNCSALFYLYPDTIPHSYFAINTASGIPQLSYSWNWGDGSATDTAAYPSHTYTAPGYYTICLTVADSSGCTDTYCHPYYLLKDEGESAMIQVNVYPPSYVGVQDNPLDDVALYPNPTQNSFIITASITQHATLTLFDALGKQLSQQTAQPHELTSGVTIDMLHRQNGLYYLTLGTAQGSRVMKVVKY